MELISKEVVRRIIESGRTREQMLEMVDSAVKIEGSSPDDSYSCDTCKHDPEPWDSDACDGCCKAHSGYEPDDSSTDCISREAAISAAKHIFKSNSEMKAFCMMKMLEELPPVKPKERTGEWKQGEIDWYKLGKCIEEGFRKGLKE